MGLGNMPVREPTDARRRASSTYAEKIKGEGVKTTLVRLSPDATAKLDQLKAASGLSANEIINRAIVAFEIGGT